MQLKGPNIYEVYVNGEDTYSIVGPGGVKNFVAPVSTRGPKIYAFSDNRKLIYIGQTVQGMSARMRLGFKADGTGGYWGYLWRKELKKATLHVWCLEGTAEDEELYALECIESEVVYLYRKTYGQWPKYQNEIHFHESTDGHRKHASLIFQVFNNVGA